MGMAAHRKMRNLRNREHLPHYSRCGLVAVFDWVPDRVGSGTKAYAQPNFPLRVFNKGRLANCYGGIRSGRQVEREAIDRVMRVRTLLPLLLLLAVSWSGATPETVSTKPKHPAPHQPTHAAASGKAHRANSHVRHVKTRRKPRSARSIARSRKLQRAFVASSQLRPMAQELATMRSPAAYAGVTAYARAHTGEAASAAYLALGHAYLLDRRYPDAAAS